MRLYEEEANCGHVGRNNFTLKVFPVKAETRKEAAEKARNLPRVKHHHKDAIRRVEEISIERYRELCLINDNDPYFLCKNVQEHRMLVVSCEVYSEDEDKVYDFEAIKKPIYVGKQLLRKPKKYIKNYSITDTRYAI